MVLLGMLLGMRKTDAMVSLAQLLTHVGSPCPSPPAFATKQVIRSQEPDGSRVVVQQLLGPRDKPLLYTKHMAK